MTYTYRHKVHIYKEYHMSPCPNWDSPIPSLASECAPPPEPKGGGVAHSPAGEGVGESLFRRLEKSLALCLLCAYRPRPIQHPLSVFFEFLIWPDSLFKYSIMQCLAFPLPTCIFYTYIYMQNTNARNIHKGQIFLDISVFKFKTNVPNAVQCYIKFIIYLWAILCIWSHRRRKNIEVKHSSRKQKF